VLHAVQHHLYRHGDRRDDWLRGPSRSFVEDVLLSSRLADHGVFRPDAVRQLVAEHMAGASLGSQLGLLIQVEQWQRYFEDGAPPAVVRRS
jgi:asparagine synthase (glutamine-hydrolysing)